jgi:hypothetical protein
VAFPQSSEGLSGAALPVELGSRDAGGAVSHRDDARDLLRVFCLLCIDEIFSDRDTVKAHEAKVARGN